MPRVGEANRHLRGRRRTDSERRQDTGNPKKGCDLHIFFSLDVVLLSLNAPEPGLSHNTVNAQGKLREVRANSSVMTTAGESWRFSATMRKREAMVHLINIDIESGGRVGMGICKDQSFSIFTAM